jgi:short-subunit dehydrogenase
MSSQGGRTSFPGVSTYSASKFALEGWSEALAGEVAPFGIRVMLVEPSRLRTAFNAADVLDFTAILPTYREILTDVRTDMAGADGNQEGDPVKAAQIVVS